MTHRRRIKIKRGQVATIVTATTTTAAAAITAVQAQTSDKVSTPASASPKPPAGMKMLELPYGIPGESLKQVQRMVPSDEPPPLPVNSELSVIGKRTRRIDADEKVTGTARYTSDVRLPGMLYGQVFLSIHPHAKVQSVDTKAAEKAPG